MDNTQMVRLFFAVLPDDHLKDTLVTQMHSLKKLPFYHSIRWTKPHHLHLTLNFIGKMPQDKISELIQNVQQKITPLPAFKLHFSRLMLFPPSSHPHILAVSIAPSLELTKLVFAIMQGAAETQLLSDKKPYIPHITLGKLKRLFIIDEAYRKINLPPLIVQQIALLQSMSTITGTEYHVIETFDLREGDPH